MPAIPKLINGVNVELSSKVNPQVNQRVIDGLRVALKKNITPGYVLQRITISDAYSLHQFKNKAVQSRGLSIDISKINNKDISTSFKLGGAVKHLVMAIQEEFENYLYRNENYGPYMTVKKGRYHPVQGYKNHIHLTVS